MVGSKGYFGYLSRHNGCRLQIERYIIQLGPPIHVCDYFVFLWNFVLEPDIICEVFSMTNLIFRSTTFDKDITPYIHVFVYHTHFFLERYGSLKAFKMEAVEQLNYVHKLVFFGASNKGKENYSITEQVKKFFMLFYCQVIMTDRF